ncbi:hypothetical protein DYH09_31260 [bacterium CPR1]|nr:hypothetical protein [bacterium CPR1]
MLRALVAILLICLPVLAAAATTQFTVVAKSERVDLVFTSSAPITYKEKMISGSLLGIEVSPAQLKPGTPKKVAIDKGLIQNVALEQRGDTVLVKLAVISRPRLLKARPEQGGRKLTLSYSTADIASSRPSGFSNLAPGKPARPATTSGAAVPAIRPSAPATSGSGTVPVRPLAASTPTPSAPSPTAATIPMINLTFQDAPLDDVFARIALQAGLMPQLDPSLTGSFTGSLVNVPLDQALQTVRQGQSIDCSVQGGYLIVKPGVGRATAAGDPPSVTATTVEPVAAVPQPALPAGPIARDYYPIRNKPAMEVLQSARSVLPNIRYTVDERLNIIIAEGSPADIERLTTLLSNVSAK